MNSAGNGPRVLVAAHQYWPTPGSASQVMAALVRELRVRGISVAVATTGDSSAVGRNLVGPHGEQVHLVSGAESSGATIRRLGDLAAFAWGCYRLGQHLRPNVVVSDPPPTVAWVTSNLVGPRHNRTFVYYFSDSWAAVTADTTSRFARAFRLLAKALEGSALRRSDLAVAVTEEMQGMARRAGASNVLLVHNGVDTELFTGTGDRWLPGAASRPFLLYAGNAGMVHGAEVFAEGAEILWREGLDFDCVYMGYGVGHAAVTVVAKRWPDRLHLVPNQPPATVAAAFRTAVGALSSLRPMPSYEHARPMKSLAGLSCGCPAVYAGSGDFAETVRANGLGFVHPWSPQGAADGMREALAAASGPDFPRWRAELAEFAREHFDEKAGARRVVDALMATHSSNGA